MEWYETDLLLLNSPHEAGVWWQAHWETNERENKWGGGENRRMREWERELKRLWVECLREMARRCAYITLTLNSSWRLKAIPQGNDVCLCVGHLVFRFQLWRRAVGYLVRKEQWVGVLEWALKWAYVPHSPGQYRGYYSICWSCVKWAVTGTLLCHQKEGIRGGQSMKGGVEEYLLARGQLFTAN